VPFLGQLRFEYGWNKELIGGFTFGFGQVFWYNFYIRYIS
jgi:outer membrane protein insertion porin family